VFILLVSFVARSLVFIEPQEAAIVISLIARDGYQDRPLRSGLHWIAPVVEDVRRYPIAWQTYTMSSNPTEGQNIGNDTVIARTQDGQQVMIDCSLIYRIDPEQVIRIHIDWQERYVEDFIRPIIRSTVRNLASQYTADEINSSRRNSLEADLNRLMQEALEDKGFVMDVFLLRNVSFTPEYAEAVERKQVAQQDVFQSQYQATQTVILANADAQAVRERAQADADALDLIADALNENPALLTYRYIERLAPNISVMLVPNDAPFILPLPTPGADGAPARSPAGILPDLTLPAQAETARTPTPTAARTPGP
jgi:regulator of protease activity HflC (stomatin/prohibitin superfamily)